jgi:hypothetical protein
MHDEPEQLAGDLVLAVERLAATLSARAIRYALMGGLATLLRGRPRFTQDVDILLDVPQLALPGLLDELAQQGFTFDREQVIREYVQEHFTCLYFGTVRIDWLKPVLPLYDRALRDATPLPWTEGCSLNVASAEGLILTKLIAFRPQDQEDIRTLLIANRENLDIDLIRREWSAVGTEAEPRTAWLDEAIAQLADGAG